MASSNRGLASVPLHGKLSAKYKDTFAYPTIKDRCPIILCKVIDHLFRDRVHIGQTYGVEAQEGLKAIIDDLSKLRYEMQTGKPIAEIADGRDNCKVWNAYLRSAREKGEGISWFTGAWMWVECYMYRQILAALTRVEPLRDFDFFRHQKEEGFRDSLPSMELLGAWLLQQLSGAAGGGGGRQLDNGNCTLDNNIPQSAQLWNLFLQISLWGNKCDLSISAGSRQTASGDPVDQLTRLKDNILVNHWQEAWNILEEKQDTNQIVDIVMDNAGFELFSDLCLADFLISCNVAKTVRFRLKNQPWFVSDTTRQDFDWSLNALLENSLPSLSQLGVRWKEYLKTGQWTVCQDPFWTYPHVYSELEQTDPALYASLAEARLVIFKGDLNYRKLVGDLNWETTVDFKNALQGFNPTNILALRTLKADVVTGLENGQAETLLQTDKDWMVNGSWGVIQFAHS